MWRNNLFFILSLSYPSMPWEHSASISSHILLSKFSFSLKVVRIDGAPRSLRRAVVHLTQLHAMFLSFTYNLDFIPVRRKDMRSVAFNAPHLPYSIRMVIRCHRDKTMVRSIPFLANHTTIIIKDTNQIAVFHCNIIQKIEEKM